MVLILQQLVITKYLHTLVNDQLPCLELSLFFKIFFFYHVKLSNEKEKLLYINLNRPEGFPLPLREMLPLYFFVSKQNAFSCNLKYIFSPTSWFRRKVILHYKQCMCQSCLLCYLLLSKSLFMYVVLSVLASSHYFVITVLSHTKYMV